MLKLTVNQIILKIKNDELFEAESSDSSFRIKIQDYVPYLCTAIHNGHQLRPGLERICALNDHERWYEEDPHTVDFIKTFPMVMEGLDSRYEYDLNRAPDKAVMNEAWGKQVWTQELTSEQISISLKKHENFYKVVFALTAKMEEKFQTGIIYDIHSYNHVRHDKVTPVFNIGTENIDDKKFGKDCEKWRRELAKIEIPHVESTSKINDMFYGRGYQLMHVTEHFSNVLVLATEVKKIYCDEINGETFPVVIDSIHEGFKKAILNHASAFIKRHGDYQIKRKSELLGGSLNKALLSVDKKLYKIAKGFELLEFVNPTNMEQERRKFFKSGADKIPEFRYRPIEIDALGLKRQLLGIPVEDIKDVDIQRMYRDTIQAYIDKIDMLSTLGTEKFLYNSLRYFGEPSDNEVDNARFLLYCPPFEDTVEEKNMGIKEATDFFNELGDSYGFQFKIKVSDNVVSPATVLNSRKTVLLKRGAKFSERSLKSLGHHEIGVHMVTTMNSNIQSLKLFNLGLPRNTLTQEGLAVFSELMSGSFRFVRMRELGYRVFAVRSVVKGESFPETYELLTRELGMDENLSFNLSTRVHRGGGFTKEHLYLEGFKQIINLHKSGKSLDNLLIGKTSLAYKDTIDEMVERGLVSKPKYLTEPFNNPEKINPSLQYILSGLK